MDQEKRRKSWQLNMIMTAGVIATILAGLIMAQLDALQSRTPQQRSGLPIVNIQATAVAVGQIIPLLIQPEVSQPEPEVMPVDAIVDDQNPRPELITGVSEEGVIFTVCGAVPDGWLLYTVRPGDSLASLAAAVQLTEAELAEANCLPDTGLTAGMQVLVPQEPVDTLCGPPQWWVRYQVRSGDNLGVLANSRGTTIDEILRANCRDSLELVAGQFIFLPPGTTSGAGSFIPQPSLTPLPTATVMPTATPSATNRPPQPPSVGPVLPTAVPTQPVFPTATPPILPTVVLPTQPPPTIPLPTQPPPTVPPPPTQPPPTVPPPPTQPPPTVPPPPTQPPPTVPPPPTEPPPTVPPPPTEPPPTVPPPPTEPPPTPVPEPEP